MATLPSIVAGARWCSSGTNRLRGSSLLCSWQSKCDFPIRFVDKNSPTSIKGRFNHQFIKNNEVRMTSRLEDFPGVSSLKNCFEINDSDIVELFLPKNYSYKILNFENIESSSLLCGEVNFDLEVRANVTNVKEVSNFLSKLNESSSCTFNKLSGRADRLQSSPSAKSLIRGYRKCCMNVFSAKGSSP